MKRAATIFAMIALALGGCAGVAPPQAPFKYAQKLDVSTSDISSACGEMYQLTAFPPPPRKDVETLQASASAAVKKLARVYHDNRNWIYQGASVATIVNQARAMLRGCGLKHAAEELKRATAHY